jgi:hypothetical protein
MSTAQMGVRLEPCCGCRIVGWGTPGSPLRIKYCRKHGSVERLIRACKLASEAFDPLRLGDGWEWVDSTLKIVERAYRRADC